MDHPIIVKDPRIDEVYQRMTGCPGSLTRQHHWYHLLDCDTCTLCGETTAIEGRSYIQCFVLNQIARQTQSRNR